jgi:hypothetical protein
MTLTAPDKPKSLYRRFLFTYRFNGSDWPVEIAALSPEEARDRVRVLAFARFHGELAPRDAPPATAAKPRRASWFGRTEAA